MRWERASWSSHHMGDGRAVVMCQERDGNSDHDSVPLERLRRRGRRVVPAARNLSPVIYAHGFAALSFFLSCHTIEIMILVLDPVQR